MARTSEFSTVKTADHQQPVPDRAADESPQELTRTWETWVAGVRHWIDPEDEDRARALADMRGLFGVGNEAAEAEQILAREKNRAPAAAVAALEAKKAETWAHWRSQLSAVYASGLELRVGQCLVLTPPGDGGWDYFMFRWFHAIGVDDPKGIAWCWTCGFVFRPSRKSHAYKCDRCHHHPPPAPLAPESAPGGGWTYALPTEKGWELVRTPLCKECGVPFRAKRSDAQRCPDRRQCRQRAAIRRENIELGFFQPV